MLKTAYNTKLRLFSLSEHALISYLPILMVKTTSSLIDFKQALLVNCHKMVREIIMLVRQCLGLICTILVTVWELTWNTELESGLQARTMTVSKWRWGRPCTLLFVTFGWKDIIKTRILYVLMLISITRRCSVRMGSCWRGVGHKELLTLI